MKNKKMLYKSTRYEVKNFYDDEYNKSDWKENSKKIWRIQKIYSELLNYAMRQYYLWGYDLFEYCQDNNIDKWWKYENDKLFPNPNKSIKNKIKKEHPELYSYIYDTLLQTVYKKWISDRYEILQLNKRQIATYKFSYPLYVHYRGYRIIEKDEKVFIKFTLYGNGHKEKRKHILFEIDPSRPGDSRRAILNNLISNKYKRGTGYLKYDKKRRKWFFGINYGFTPKNKVGLDSNIIVGIDWGLNCPFFCAVNNSYKRLNSFKDKDFLLAKKSYFEKLRRSILSQGAKIFNRRGGHGKDRKMRPLELWRNKYNNYKKNTIYCWAKAIIEFALENNAGLIQLENLSDIKNNARKKLDKISTNNNSKFDYKSYLKELFLNKILSFPIYEFQNRIIILAKEYGIKVVLVDPKFTSQRCSNCGHINKENRNGKKFNCELCGYSTYADYNAARNLATKNIDKIIDKWLYKNSTDLLEVLKSEETGDTLINNTSEVALNTA